MKLRKRSESELAVLSVGMGYQMRAFTVYQKAAQP